MSAPPRAANAPDSAALVLGRLFRDVKLASWRWFPVLRRVPWSRPFQTPLVIFGASEGWVVKTTPIPHLRRRAGTGRLETLGDPALHTRNTSTWPKIPVVSGSSRTEQPHGRGCAFSRVRGGAGLAPEQRVRDPWARAMPGSRGASGAAGQSLQGPAAPTSSPPTACPPLSPPRTVLE